MYESRRSMPGLRCAADYESQIILQILLDTRNEVFSNSKKLFAAERAYEVDVYLQSMPVVATVVRMAQCGESRNRSG